MGYKVIYINNALDYVDGTAVWNMLCDSLRLRVRGYRKEYGIDVLPLSKDDFFSTQVLIYKGEKLVCTYKFTRQDLCDRYRIKFPLIAALEDGGITEHTDLIQAILENAKNKGRLIAYCGGWTIDPELRLDEENARVVRELVIATHYDYLKRFGVEESIICGVIKFKAHLLQESSGYKRIQRNGENVGAVGLAYLNFEPVYMLHLTEHNEHAEKIYSKHRSVLDSAIIYSNSSKEPNIEEKQAA